jgi:hypothetical protein
MGLKQKACSDTKPNNAENVKKKFKKNIQCRVVQ